MHTALSADKPSAPPASATTPALPELLAPAGDWECARAAVENGADAIYFGLDKFNARMRANNFTEADLPQLMAFLHRRGVKGYLTFNTLVFANELDDARSLLLSVIRAGVDAAIVQDVGVCSMIRSLSPDFPIHASTQMTVTSAAGLKFCEDLGCQLVVLARECSMVEIERLRTQHLARPNPREMPLEVFVHGALCVAYSGQCLTSESLGGRSANRGECAQACRMPYELVADDAQVPLGDRRYLLSPRDLAGMEVLPELVRLGLASLKIEGRLKTPEYVANITRAYRGALDRLGRDHLARGSTPSGRMQVEAPVRYNLEMAFSRGLHTGWFGGVNNQELVHARFGKKRGVYLGDVTRIQGTRVQVRLISDLKPGDGIVFDAGTPDVPEEGGRVFGVDPAQAPGTTRLGETWLSFGDGRVDFTRIHVGDKAWKTSDQVLENELRRTFSGDAPRTMRPLRMSVEGSAGLPMKLRVADEEGHVAEACSSMPLAAALKQPLTQERLKDQLGRLGGSPFKLDSLEVRMDEGLILPVSELNKMRREAIAALETLRATPRRWSLVEPPAQQYPPHSWPQAAKRPKRDMQQLIVLVRSHEQLEAVLSADVDTIYCELEDPKAYRNVVRRVHEANAADGKPRTIWVAPPRIAKSGEEWILDQVLSCQADGYLARNYDHLEWTGKARLTGDFSLNVANPIAAAYFLEHWPLERVTASYDLNNLQLEALLQTSPPEWWEITIHQHMPMFHMEHCIFCAFLSKGTDFRNCGRPCDTRALRLRDRVGAEHPVKADAGCRNTVFNSLAQTGAEYVGRLIALGVRHFRIEFLLESGKETAKTIALYQQLLRGEVTGEALWRELRVRRQLGVTRGPMEKPERLNRTVFD